MNLCNIGHSFDYELEKLIRVFLPFEKIRILHSIESDARYAVVRREPDGAGARLETELWLDGRRTLRAEHASPTDEDFEKLCERRLAILLYACFTELTGCRPPWGILTGVRPAKLFSRLCAAQGEQAAARYFSEELRVEETKLALCRRAVEGEERITALSRPDSFSLYLSVPFCPTRCSYCSFVSHSVDRAKKLIPEYVRLLCEELRETARLARENGLRLETVYIGGGTPTVLSAEQLETVMSTVCTEFDLSSLREYTVEAGRPDTVTAEKLAVIRRGGATRISVNPQTMNDAVLAAIGRRHTVRQTVEAFRLAREQGFDNINMDLIAGLPADTPESFRDTLAQVLALDPESVTVHALSMKRASSLTTGGLLPDAQTGLAAAQMVDYARRALGEKGIFPYYMYRQSKTVGNLENVGYAKRGYECLYNVYIMDETHTILACGASAVTKLREPGGDYIERIFNFKYPYEYISRFSELMKRKEGITAFYEKYPAKHQ